MRVGGRCRRLTSLRIYDRGDAWLLSAKWARLMEELDHHLRLQVTDLPLESSEKRSLMLNLYAFRLKLLSTSYMGR